MPTVIASAKTQARAFELRMAGASYAQIADGLGLETPYAASRAVEGHLKNTIGDESRASAGLIDVERLNRMTYLLWEKFEKDPTNASAEVLMKIMKQRADMLGLNFRDLVAEKRLELEQDKVRLVARALGMALAKNGISGTQYTAVTRDMMVALRELDAGRSEVESILDGTEFDYIDGEIIDDEDMIG